MPPKLRVFLDSSALIAGVVSPSGGAHAILVLAEAGYLDVVISRQVHVECERNLGQKSPRAAAVFAEMLRALQPEIVPDPPRERVTEMEALINAKDASVLAAAMMAAPDYLVSLDRQDFLSFEIARKTGLRIGTPDDVLAWLREWMASA